MSISDCRLWQIIAAAEGSVLLAIFGAWLIWPDPDFVSRNEVQSMIRESSPYITSGAERYLDSTVKANAGAIKEVNSSIKSLEIEQAKTNAKLDVLLESIGRPKATPD